MKRIKPNLIVFLLHKDKLWKSTLQNFNHAFHLLEGSRVRKFGKSWKVFNFKIIHCLEEFGWKEKTSLVEIFSIFSQKFCKNFLRQKWKNLFFLSFDFTKILLKSLVQSWVLPWEKITNCNWDYFAHSSDFMRILISAMKTLQKKVWMKDKTLLNKEFQVTLAESFLSHIERVNQMFSEFCQIKLACSILHCIVVSFLFDPVNRGNQKGPKVGMIKRIKHCQIGKESLVGGF